MTVFISKQKDAVTVLARPESQGIFGDAVWTIKHGDSFLGHPYDWWAALEDGKHEVDPA
jgi:hypothetical protein